MEEIRMENKKMNPMKFNAVEVLPALLDKTKLTTMRKAWRVMTENFNRPGPLFEDKPAKWNVGDVVEAVWTGDREELLKAEAKELTKVESFEREYRSDFIGEVRITKVEKIIIRWNRIFTYGILPYTQIEWEGSLITRIASREGFKSPKQMFDYLESYAGDLSKAKIFWLYTLEWLK